MNYARQQVAFGSDIFIKYSLNKLIYYLKSILLFVKFQLGGF